MGTFHRSITNSITNLGIPAETVVRMIDPTAQRDAARAPELLHFHCSDHGNSERLIAMFGDSLRYCPFQKKWFPWDGRRWAPDITGQARRMVKLTMLEYLRQAQAADYEPGEKFALRSMDSSRINNTLVEVQDQVPLLPSERDTHPYLLNFLNGTVDVRTGEIREHRREDFLTKLVHHKYDPAAQCPRFLQFLDEVTGVSPDSAEAEVERSGKLVVYLQRAFGYSLTGVTSEKAVFFLHGPRDNGKSTLLATFLKLIDEYAVLLQIDSLMVKPGGENNNTQADLADLRGARFVMTSETEEGQRLAEGKLKRITQGTGRIKAIRKYENPIEFDETHKLWIDANHLPVVRSHDDATWRRLHTIPFNVIIPRERQDRELSSKLLAEAEGILAWAVAGATKWYRDGLAKPDVIEEANTGWRKDMNQVGRFIEERCIQADFVRAKARVLFQEYQKWAEGAGERSITERSFTDRLKEMGYEKAHTKAGNEYIGIGLAAAREETGERW